MFKILKIVFYIIILLLSIYIILFIGNSIKVKNNANNIISEVERYKNQFDSLPNSLKDIGIFEKLEGPVFYQKEDSLNYIIWYGTFLGESNVYYSKDGFWR